MATQILGPGPDNIVVDGANAEVIDFGGTDTYTISPNLSGDVTLSDTQASNIVLLEGLNVTAARFLSNGVQFEVNGHTLTLLGRPDLFTFKFGGSPFDPNAGAALSFTQTAAAFGTTVPPTGTTAPNEATNVGEINTDGTVGASENIIPLAGQTAVTAVDGVAEVFVLDFDSSSGTSLSSDAVVTIAGFDPAEDILRFNDAADPPISMASFLDVEAGGALIAADGFANTTTISFQDDDPADASPAAQITLLGIADATLGGAAPFYEIV